MLYPQSVGGFPGEKMDHIEEVNSSPGGCSLIEIYQGKKQNAEGWVLMADAAVVGL